MKKNILLIIVLLLFTINADAFAQVSTNETLSTIENNFFGYDYTNESENKRLERLENHLYGEKKSGNIKDRLANIQNDTGIIVKEEKPVTAAKQEFSNNSNIPAQNNLPKSPNLQEDSSVDYPIVDKMEEEILHTTYKNEDIYNRLNRLEEKVFNKTSSDDLNIRVNKLASAIVPVQRSYQNQDYTMRDLDNYYNNSGLNTINNDSIPFQLAVLEEDLFKNSYVNDNMSNRLGRLEQKLFKRTFVNDSDITRLQRIMVAYDAKKNSYKYENNRKMQNMATFSQIGGILLMILAILL